MKFSSKIERCELSPMRKYAPYANAARQGHEDLPAEHRSAGH